ncbi:hypothetical protein HYH03_013019 [Edaphochlamys debaryana]|uniref:ceramide glucosyltransferase n=1 Tax=Edaphochlamys debaryana TaxID=47281 RepID=A0A836BTG4_9CHLO|nr:hypothetical protein HYH03_013019 [Edaphochlamys debaryana]|eukprot:KAG2488516.1 hypothetical protein HYH03_013019 [Edaphochlamys debaryana]
MAPAGGPGLRLMDYLQLQALLWWLVLAAGWAWSGTNRRRERLRRLAAARQPAPAACGPAPPPLPPVSVVMPVKGVRPHSEANWRSQLGVTYGGQLEFVFVVESPDDPALPVLEVLAAQHAQQGAARGPARGVRVVVAGEATACSQKAHNLVAGIESCDPNGIRPAGIMPDAAAAAAAEGYEMVDAADVRAEAAAAGEPGSAAAGAGYVLILDDDVALHPGSVAELVAEMEAQPGLFMATGYPFDVPPPGSSLPAHLAAAYHLPLLIAFSVAPDTAFVWGGCVMLRRGELLPEDPRGLLRAWRDGGYSDDLILASFCTERGLRIRVPPYAIFPQRLDARMSLPAWLNYLHRQLFVLDTYTSPHNRATNHTMMLLHSLLSWALVLPSLAALATLCARLLSAVVDLSAPVLAPLGTSGAAALAAAAASLAAVAAGLAAVATGLAARRQQAQAQPATDGGSGGGLGDRPAAVVGGQTFPQYALPAAIAGLAMWWAAASSGAVGAAQALPIPASLLPVLHCLPPLPVGVLAVVVGWAVAHAALVFMTAEILGLFAVLSPSAPPIPLSAFSWARLWAGLLGSNAALPLVMAATYLSPTVEWAGVTYRKHRGRVTPIARRPLEPATPSAPEAQQWTGPGRGGGSGVVAGGGLVAAAAWAAAAAAGVAAVAAMVAAVSAWRAAGASAAAAAGAAGAAGGESLAV